MDYRTAAITMSFYDFTNPRFKNDMETQENYVNYRDLVDERRSVVKSHIPGDIIYRKFLYFRDELSRTLMLFNEGLGDFFLFFFALCMGDIWKIRVLGKSN